MATPNGSCDCDQRDARPPGKVTINAGRARPSHLLVPTLPSNETAGANPDPIPEFGLATTVNGRNP
jgi:hypothetical protein